MLTIEEITLIAMYKSPELSSRKQILKNLEDVIPHFTTEEQEMKELTQSVIRKLTAMTDKYFEKINFDLALDYEESIN